MLSFILLVIPGQAVSTSFCGDVIKGLYSHLIRPSNHLSLYIFEAFDTLCWDCFGTRLLIDGTAIDGVLRHFDGQAPRRR